MERAAGVVAIRVLASVHNASPYSPVEVMLEDLDMEDQHRAERVVADVAEALL